MLSASLNEQDQHHGYAQHCFKQDAMCAYTRICIANAAAYSLFLLTPVIVDPT